MEAWGIAEDMDSPAFLVCDSAVAPAEAVAADCSGPVPVRRWFSVEAVIMTTFPKGVIRLSRLLW
jgi:hypothetical protein